MAPSIGPANGVCKHPEAVARALTGPAPRKLKFWSARSRPVFAFLLLADPFPCSCRWCAPIAVIRLFFSRIQILSSTRWDGVLDRCQALVQHLQLVSPGGS